MKEYKVIKDFDIAKVGDVFTEVEPDIYYMSHINEKQNYRSEKAMTINKTIVDSLVKDGILQEDKQTSPTLDMINNLLDNYSISLSNLLEKYNNKEIPTCAKVEAETVYYNLNKVLNKIKESLENEQMGKDCK